MFKADYLSSHNTVLQMNSVEIDSRTPEYKNLQCSCLLYEIAVFAYNLCTSFYISEFYGQ